MEGGGGGGVGSGIYRKMRTVQLTRMMKQRTKQRTSRQLVEVEKVKLEGEEKGQEEGEGEKEVGAEGEVKAGMTNFVGTAQPSGQLQERLSSVMRKS